MTIDTKKVFTAPKGIFRFPALIKPDYGDAKFPKKDGQFKTGILYTMEQAKPLLNMLKPMYDEAELEAEKAFAALGPAQRKKLEKYTMNDLYTEVYEKGSEVPTGEVSVSFSTGYSGVNKKGEKWTKKLAIFDATGKPATGLTSIYGGTEGRVSFTVAPYFVDGTGTGGLKLYLSAVQVIKLVSGGSGTAEDNGFGVEEGGYSSPETPTFPEGDQDNTDPDDF